MAPYISFLMEHWMLSTGFLVVVLLLIANEWRLRAMGVGSIPPQQLVNFLNHEGAVVVDVRAPSSFDQGHILGALNIPMSELNQRLTTLNKYKSKPLILVCSAGADSPKCGKLLKQNGFTQLYYLSGGIQSWLSQGLPLTKK